MSITTYTELKSAIAAWSARNDLTSVIPDFITFAEAKFNRRLMTTEQETTLASTAIDANYQITIPTDLAALKYLWIVDSPYTRVEQKGLDFVVANQVPGGRPTYFAWNGTKFQFDGTSSNITGTYYANVPALSGSNATNWLLTASPDLYLWASLEGLYTYLKNDADRDRMQAMADALIDELNGVTVQNQTSGGKLIARTRNVSSARVSARF